MVLQKTSIQLQSSVLSDMAHWPGLTQSEAIRLAVERGHYLSTLNSESIAGLAERYEPILTGALEDLDYGDYRLAARSLPAIVAGYVGENQNRSWRGETPASRDLDPAELVNQLTALSAVDRIGILDCVVAARHRFQANAPESPKAVLSSPPTARHFEAEIRRRWAAAQSDGASHVDILAKDLHHAVGGYPAAKGQHRMAVCCGVMYKLKEPQDKILSAPPKGKGALLSIRYFFPRNGDA